MSKEVKAIVLEVTFEKNEVVMEQPPITLKLEQESKLAKEYKLEDIIQKLEHAANIRDALKQVTEERLRTASQEREE